MSSTLLPEKFRRFSAEMRTTVAAETQDIRQTIFGSPLEASEALDRLHHLHV